MTLAGLAATGFALVLIENEPDAQLWARRDHDPMAIRELGRRYSDFARRVVRSYVHHRKVPGRYRMDELLSTGHVGLMSAVRRFEPERGWKLECPDLGFFHEEVHFSLPALGPEADQPFLLRLRTGELPDLFPLVE